MAISTNPLLSALHGAIAKQLVVRQVNGKTIVSSFPHRDKRKFTDRQLELQMLMKLANISAHEITGNAEKRDAAQLRLNVPREKLYTALIREFFQKEKIRQMRK